MRLSAFERYAPFIQEYIYRKQWTDLREVQVEACEAILDTDKHVIIASGTASGKTEAAFFPILTLLKKYPSKSVGVMYIGPLKALINDQFERLDELLSDSDIPIWPWHGDISQTIKKRALSTARGIVQITPESLEALIMRHPGDAVRLFCDLRFIVIDEIHALMGADRGLQVLCLISRLEKLTGCSPRRIGLSATLNDYQPAKDYLSAGSRKGAIAVGIQKLSRKIALCVESFVMPDETEKTPAALQEYYDFLYDNCHTSKCLVFTNSRVKAEEIIASLKGIALSRGDCDIFYVHHGNVSASLRQETEHALRDNAGPTVAAATLTLELGIDIGDLDSTIQDGAPYSCSSFVQRLGRAGRRTGKPRMTFVNLKSGSGDGWFSELPWDLLQSIAVIQLYIEERWVEPFKQKKKPFSLLAHQTISTLMTLGELSPSDLARNVLLLPPFKDTVSADEYRELLQYMLMEDYLQRMDNGGVIVGLKGERIANNYHFYAVFQDEEAFKVMSSEGEIGTLQDCPAVGEVFVLAGKRWKTVEVDQERKTIYVVREKTFRVSNWKGNSGDIHTKVVKRMKQSLQEEIIYPYLRPNAMNLLTEAREHVDKVELLKSDIIPHGNTSFYFCPWVGTKELGTIRKLLVCGAKQQLGIISETSRDSKRYLDITSSLGAEKCIELFSNLQINADDPNIVLTEDSEPMIDKYDYMVPKNLLRQAYLYNQVDVPAAIEIMRDAAKRY